MPVLSPGSSPLRVLHISDIPHAAPAARKQAWATGTGPLGARPRRQQPAINLSHPKAVPAVVQALGACCRCPRVRVRQQRHFAPRMKNPLNYLTNPGHRLHGEPLPGKTCGRPSRSAAGWI